MRSSVLARCATDTIVMPYVHTMPSWVRFEGEIAGSVNTLEVKAVHACK